MSADVDVVGDLDMPSWRTVLFNLSMCITLVAGSWATCRAFLKRTERMMNNLKDNKYAMFLTSSWLALKFAWQCVLILIFGISLWHMAKLCILKRVHVDTKFVQELLDDALVFVKRPAFCWTVVLCTCFGVALALASSIAVYDIDITRSDFERVSNAMSVLRWNMDVLAIVYVIAFVHLALTAA